MSTIEKCYNSAMCRAGLVVTGLTGAAGLAAAEGETPVTVADSGIDWGALGTSLFDAIKPALGIAIGISLGVFAVRRGDRKSVV